MTQPNTKSFLSNAAMYGIGGILLEAASIVLLPLYLNYLSPEDFGTLEILNRLGTFVVIGLMANGLRMATYTFYLQETSLADRKRVAATVSVALFLILLLGTIITFAAAPWLVEWLKLANESILVFGMVTVLLESLVIIPLALMQARIESFRYVSTTLAMFLAKVVLIVYLVSALELGLWGVLIARSVIAVFFGAILNGLELRTSSFKVNWNTLKGVVGFALPFLPGGVLAFFINNGDRFYLIRQAGEHEVGIYSLSYRIAGAISLLAFTPLYKVWSAKMYAAATLSDAPQVFGATFTRLMASLVCTGLAVFLFADDLLHVMGGYAYMDAIQYIPPLLVAVVLMSSAELMDSGFYITRKTKYKPAIYFVTGIVIFFAYSLLIPRFGGFGAAWATLIAYAIHAMLTWHFTQKVFYVKYEWLRLSAIIGSALICGLASTLLAPVSHHLQINLTTFFVWIAFMCVIATETERRSLLDTLRRVLKKAPAKSVIETGELSCRSDRI